MVKEDDEVLGDVKKYCPKNTCMIAYGKELKQRFKEKKSPFPKGQSS
jgi:hypothetical protein